MIDPTKNQSTEHISSGFYLVKIATKNRHQGPAPMLLPGKSPLLPFLKRPKSQEEAPGRFVCWVLVLVCLEDSFGRPWFNWGDLKGTFENLEIRATICEGEDGWCCKVPSIIQTVPLARTTCYYGYGTGFLNRKDFKIRSALWSTASVRWPEWSGYFSQTDLGLEKRRSASAPPFWRSRWRPVLRSRCRRARSISLAMVTCAGPCPRTLKCAWIVLEKEGQAFRKQTETTHMSHSRHAILHEGSMHIDILYMRGSKGFRVC